MRDERAKDANSVTAKIGGLHRNPNNKRYMQPESIPMIENNEQSLWIIIPRRQRVIDDQVCVYRNKICSLRFISKKGLKLI